MENFKESQYCNFQGDICFNQVDDRRSRLSLYFGRYVGRLGKASPVAHEYYSHDNESARRSKFKPSIVHHVAWPSNEPSNIEAPAKDSSTRLLVLPQQRGSDGIDFIS